MNGRVWFAIGLIGAAATSASTIRAQDAFAPPAARIVRSSPGRPLTAASNASPTAIVRQYLAASGSSGATVESLELVSQGRVARTGVTHARFLQRVGGLQVYGVYAKASLNARGELISLIENLVPVRAAKA